MKDFSCFDIIGPIMIGPSSSHTAGAARLGKIASIIAGSEICCVKFLLHGSFAKTYKGHGTDKALVAGILGLDPWDENLKNSFSLAVERKLNFEFIETDLGYDIHPNTVKFLIDTKLGKHIEITGASIGGGNILITEMDGQAIEFTGTYPTIIVEHQDIPGMISKVSTLIYNFGINIAFLKVYRSSKGTSASMIFEIDSAPTELLIQDIKKLPHIQNIIVVNPIKEGE